MTDDNINHGTETYVPSRHNSINENRMITGPDERFVRTERILGRGSTKMVYQARDEDEGVDVAWHQIDITKASEQALQKMRNEVAVLQLLEPHPNIVTLFHFWESSSDGLLVFITEMVPGGTLKNFIAESKTHRLKLKVVKRITRQVLQGLHYLHTRSTPIVHRDLKCDNIYIDAHNCAIKIGDFGLSGSSSSLICGRTSRVEFMPPEALSDDHNYGTIGDVYAAGMCVLEMVTGEYPYQECSNDDNIIRTRVLQGVLPEAIHSFDEEAYRNSVTSASVVEFIECALQPADRRPTAAELLVHPFMQIEEVTAASPTLSHSGSQSTPWVIAGTPAKTGEFVSLDAPQIDGSVETVRSTSTTPTNKQGNSIPNLSQLPKALTVAESSPTPSPPSEPLPVSPQPLSFSSHQDPPTTTQTNVNPSNTTTNQPLPNTQTRNESYRHEDTGMTLQKVIEEVEMNKALLDQLTKNYHQWRGDLCGKIKNLESELSKLSKQSEKPARPPT